MTMEFIDQTQLDAMACGPFNNKSYFGYKSSILKSGICKYFRREQTLKLEWCIIEMFRFGLKNKGMMTNVINRIRILIMEEIVCSIDIDLIKNTFIKHGLENKISEFSNRLKYTINDIIKIT